MSETRYHHTLKILSVGLCTALSTGLLCSWPDALVVTPIAMAPLAADWAWQRLRKGLGAKTEAVPAVDNDDGRIDQAAPPSVPDSPVATAPVPVHYAVDPEVQTPGTSAWNTQLPELIGVFEGLAQNIIADINWASQSFILQLGDIERQILATNTLHVDALDGLSQIDEHAQTHHDERERLDQAIAEAQDFGEQIRDEVDFTRSTLRDVGGSIEILQREISQIGRVAMSVNILALNAGIEAARAGQAGAGFTVIAKDIRALATETQGLTDRLTPLTSQIRKTVVEFASQTDRSGAREAGIGARLSEQAQVLNELKTTLDTVSTQHEQLIRSQRDSVSGSHAAGVEIEKAIRMSLSTAQYGDIIRQQLETIINGMSEVREIAGSASENAVVQSRLQAVLEKLSDLYVMKAQRDAHARSTSSPTKESANSKDDDLEPAMELF